MTDFSLQLKAHAQWVESLGREGRRANLQRANLQRAILAGAILRGANPSTAVAELERCLALLPSLDSVTAPQAQAQTVRLGN